MKKIFILLLTILLFAGCGNKKEKQEQEEYTDYINNAKNAAFVETINNYISIIRNEVNSGKYQIYDSNVLYLIPAGDNKEYSCTISSTGSFVKWSYLYIGVKYEDYSYRYYAIGEEENAHGVPFIEQRDLSVDKIYNSSRIKEDGYDVLQELYNTKGSNTIYEPNNQTKEYSKLSKILPITKESYKKVVIVGSNNCES